MESRIIFALTFESLALRSWDWKSNECIAKDRNASPIKLWNLCAIKKDKTGYFSRVKKKENQKKTGKEAETPAEEWDLTEGFGIFPTDVSLTQNIGCASNSEKKKDKNSKN